MVMRSDDATMRTVTSSLPNGCHHRAVIRHVVLWTFKEEVPPD
jgi:hypothetical protein